MVGLQFLEAVTPGSSKKEIELQRARILFQAAKFSHERRKQAHTLPKTDLVIRQGAKAHPPRVEDSTRDAFLHRATKGGLRPVSETFHDYDEKHMDDIMLVQTQVTHTRQRIVPGDGACFRGYKTDPFNCFPSDRPDAVAWAVSYYTEIVAPVMAPIHNIFNVTNANNVDHIELMSHPDFQYNSLASFSIMTEKVRDPLAKPSENALLYLGTATRRLRKRITQLHTRNDSLGLMSAFMLAIASRFLGDNDSYRLHLTGVRNMVNAAGGLDAYDDGNMAKCMILQLEGFWALIDGETWFPEFRVPIICHYPEHPFTEDESDLIVQLPEGFKHLALQGRLSRNVIEALVRVVEAENKKRKGHPLVEPAKLFRPSKLRYSDWWEAFPCLATPETTVPDLEKTMVLAVMVYSCRAFSDRSSSVSMMAASRAKLTGDLPVAAWRNNAEKECLIWCAIVVLDAWRAPSGQLFGPGMHLCNGLRQSQLFDKQSHEGISTVARKFFTTDNMLQVLKLLS